MTQMRDFKPPCISTSRGSWWSYEDNFNFLTKMCLTRMREVAYHIVDLSARIGAHRAGKRL